MTQIDLQSSSVHFTAFAKYLKYAYKCFMNDHCYKILMNVKVTPLKQLALYLFFKKKKKELNHCPPITLQPTQSLI